MSQDGDNRQKRKVEEITECVRHADSEHVLLKQISGKRLRAEDTDRVISGDELIGSNVNILRIDDDTGEINESSVISYESIDSINSAVISHEVIVNFNGNTEQDEVIYNMSNPVINEEIDNIPRSVISGEDDNIPSTVNIGEDDSTINITDEDTCNIVGNTRIIESIFSDDSVSRWENCSDDSNLEIVSSENSSGELWDLDEESDLSFLSAESYSTVVHTESVIRVFRTDSPVGEPSECLDGSAGADKCPICLETLTLEIGSPDVCEHLFCLGCINEWSKRKKTCPVDRMTFNTIIVILRNPSFP